uniref:Lipopolysaccharide biosynthesis protein n=1 Tax=Desulfovibrio sp. U5L TaxID=596152 RepID=I2Q7R8_9BACT
MHPTKFYRLFQQFIFFSRHYGLRRAISATGCYVKRRLPWGRSPQGSGGLDLAVSTIPYESQASLTPPPGPIKLLAYYLPQFHPIPENNQWWGEGFTEWINVARAKPLYPGHNQPDLPGPLGFYDLRLPEILRQQVRMAKQHGIYGFCFHYYWFSGKRLLELPLDRFLEDDCCDMPFCLNWANENWTRRWDGRDQEILMQQRHCPEDDRAIMTDLLRYFADPRYIRVEGRPVLLVYHAGLLPDMAATLERWRDVCREKGEAAPYFVMVQSFANHDPHKYGFDAAAQFPPHLAHDPQGFDKTTIEGISPLFCGHVIAYEEMARKTLAGFTESFPLFPCVCPSWDNTPRRGESATIYAGSTPEKYAAWLHAACDHAVRTLPEDRAFVFVNAWNEWAEGAHLEPGQNHGYAFLNATSQVLADMAGAGRALSDPALRLRIVFISHDAARAGAQKLLLEHMRWLSWHAAVDMRLILLEDGPLRQSFEAVCPVLICGEKDLAAVDFHAFCGQPDLIFGNTAVAAAAYPFLAALNVPIITHVHELEQSLQKFAGQSVLEKMRRYTHRYVAASEAVRRNLIASHGVAPENVRTVDAFITPAPVPELRDRGLVRRDLGLPQNALLVLGCGSRDWRKGVDLFVEVARRVLAKPECPPVTFVWVGGGHDPSIPDPRELAHRYGLDASVCLVGERDNPLPYFLAADLFLLSSREDPFPLVCLEAASCGTPILCFDEAGGMPDFVRLGGGVVVPREDVEAMARETGRLLLHGTERERLGRVAREKLLAYHTTAAAAPHLLAYCRETAGKPHPVSVIVPNYNYAPYLNERLASIFSQTFQDFEVVILDDASTDDSLTVLAPWTQKAAVRLVAATQNSGNVFVQWRKGLELAKGAFLWIAEADDTAAPHFLASMLPTLSRPDVTLAYSIPRVIDGSGTVAEEFDYRRSYLAYASEDRWRESYVVAGEDEIREALAIANCIPNVSAAVFRIPPSELIEACQAYRCSGDWLFYLLLADRGKVAYVHGNLAFHRRHDNSVVAKDHQAKGLLLREEMRQLHQLAEERFGPLPEETVTRMRRFFDSL